MIHSLPTLHSSLDHFDHMRHWFVIVVLRMTSPELRGNSVKASITA